VLAEQFGIDYHIPITKENKLIQEIKQLELLRQYNIDLVVLAKYMQVLSSESLNSRKLLIFITRFTCIYVLTLTVKHDRGVKIIGATAHYITSDLDAGPIIHQDVVPGKSPGWCSWLDSQR